DTLDIIGWAWNNRVLYVNTSVEEWDPYADIRSKPALQKSIYYRYLSLLEMKKKGARKTTAIVDHGANPGLISHFVKQGLLDLAERLLELKQVTGEQRDEINLWLGERNFAALAKTLGVKVIHCSERDTQLTNRPKKPDEFVGTWSAQGMHSESISPVEIGWGTHEKTLPAGAIIPEFGPGNEIILPRLGINTLARSWVPEEEFVGLLIPHGEIFSLSHYLTLRENSRVVYRPTVCYVYLPCNETLVSLHELRCRNYELQSKIRILTDEITAGEDKLGALIMGHPLFAWWIGSCLSIKQSKKLVPQGNCTTLQVASGAVSALVWAIEHTQTGICFPEDLPHQAILTLAKAYLGNFISKPVQWSPLSNYQSFFPNNEESQPDAEDIWQFKNFLFRP
ncbi:MAG: homospermidine synthase, partial [Candidatus Omnitrophica bacterium]|nr:homospermidine synthase [Candidatus Omnitrophota bacterium]